MLPGFLPFSRATFMFDFVVVAMVGVLPVLTWSLYVVKYQKNYVLHKWIQVGLASVLGVTVLAFEIEVRTHDWWQHTEASPYSGTTLFNVVIGVHLFIAISTTLLWIATITLALRKFPIPPAPGEHSMTHLRIAKVAAAGMYLTAVTGWTFYWMAFVAS